MDTTTKLVWDVRKGGVAKLTTTGSNSGTYATVLDGRVRVTVYRHRRGLKGDRSYAYTFGAVMYAPGCASGAFTEIQLPDGSKSDPKRVLAAVEQFVISHV